MNQLDKFKRNFIDERNELQECVLHRLNQINGEITVGSTIELWDKGLLPKYQKCME